MTRDFRLLPEPSGCVLTPFDRREAMTIEAAAQLAGYSAAHTRRLVAQWELGRRIGNGAWKVSRVAWRLFLDGDGEGLRAYHEGRRDPPRVASAFAAIGASDLEHRTFSLTRLRDCSGCDSPVAEVDDGTQLFLGSPVAGRGLC